MNLNRRIFSFSLPLLLLVGFFISAGAAQAAALPAHLWHFDECEGNILKDSVGAEDLPQNPTWTVGKWQCAINQSWQAQYYIEKTFSVPLPAGELTLSLYWRNSAFPNEGRNHLYLKKADGNIAAGIRPSIYSRTLYYDGGATTMIPAMPSDNNWHLITITYSSNSLIYYLDGEQKAIFNGDYAIKSPITNLEIKGENWPVDMDELAIWHRVLSGAEVSEIYQTNRPLQPYNPPLAPEPARLIDLWHFDEGAGAIAADSAGATAISPIVKWTEGKFGQGIEHTWLSDYLISKDLNQAIESKDLSIDFWWQNSAYPNEGRVSLELQNSAGAKIFGIKASPFHSSYYFDGAEIFTEDIPYDNQWHHLAIVYDSYNFYLAFYIDGVEKMRVPQTWFKRPITKLVIRGENWLYNIDELAIWQGALSPAEVKSYYDSGKSHGPVQPEPVILVPGIMGSYLYSSIDPGVEVWPAVIKTIADPWDFHLNQLIMDEQGKPSGNSMVVPPQDIIRSVLDKDFFAGLIDELKQNGYEENKNLFVFPYDWRLDLNWTASGIPYSGFTSLKEKIEQVKSQTGAVKVNIVAHSLGGLAVKYYLKHYGVNSVDKFIDIATPHLGAPEALKVLMYGSDLGFKFHNHSLLNLDRAKTISQNLPSIYQLLPSRDYFDDTNPDYAYYIYDLHDLDHNSITGRLNYPQSIDFLKNMGRNNYLLGFNDILHSDIDNYSPVSDGIKTYNIVGCGRPTIGQIFVLNKEQSGKYEYGLKYITGDGTVPLRSAEALAADENYYVRGAEHAVMPSTDGIRQITAAILKDTISNLSLKNYPTVARNNVDCSLNGTQISFHSPIELNVYDENNNHIGPDTNGDIELNIVGAQYDIIDGNKFVFLPTGHDYKIVGQATNSGSFNARTQTIQNGQYIETAYYNQIPLNNASTTAQLQISNGQLIGIMELDQNGDQIFETQIEPSAILNQGETADLTKPETEIEISGLAGHNGYYISTTTVVLTATDNQGGSGILKTEYSLANGQSWQDYLAPTVFNGDGEYNILYKSTDRAGNVEAEKTQKIKIDKTAPIINILLPLENQEFMHDEFFIPEDDISDNYSGLATSSLQLLLDGQLIGQTKQDLFYYSLGRHTLKLAVSDLAGNQAETSVNFTVGADLDSTISDVSRSYDLGWINQEKVRDWLIKELNQIKKFQEKFGQKQNKLKQKREKIMSQCLKNKSQAWCEEKVGRHYNKAVYRLNQNYQKTILKRYQEILKKLDGYYKKQWLNGQGYGMIQRDIEYLISDL